MPLIFDFLDSLGIEHVTTEHEPAFTVEDAARITSHIAGGHTKNLLLESKTGSLCMLSCLDSQSVKINGLTRLLGLPKMSFAKPERMIDVLAVRPGSLSPFALINDRDKQVLPVLDMQLFDDDHVNFHPLDNAKTTTIRSEDLTKFLEALGYQAQIIDMNETLSA